LLSRGTEGIPHHLLLAQFETGRGGWNRLGKRFGFWLRGLQDWITHGRIVAQSVDNVTECHYDWYLPDRRLGRLMGAGTPRIRRLAERG
jgi:hypothetical protein